MVSIVKKSYKKNSKLSLKIYILNLKLHLKKQVCIGQNFDWYCESKDSQVWT